MSSTRKRWYRGQAIPVADEIMDALRDAGAVDASRLLWVGSLRRNKADVGDVEILFVPVRGLAPDQGDLFGSMIETDKAADAINALVKRGVLAKRPKEDGTFTWGAQNKLAVHTATGMPVDLFAATVETWPNLLVCRTGPAALNAIIAQRAKDRGWRWNPYGAGFYGPDGQLKVPVRCEADVFQAVDLPPTDPIYRDRLAQQIQEAGRV
ncbi:MAG: hypothetical protein J0L84_20215 [Verrucomicrobia bacterium]|nr:hypothetical protein [Verrucomicrobiota bacterium]